MRCPNRRAGRSSGTSCIGCSDRGVSGERTRHACRVQRDAPRAAIRRGDASEPHANDRRAGTRGRFPVGMEGLHIVVDA